MITTIDTAIDIQHLRTRRELLRFVKLAWKVYRDDPNWVPPLIGETIAFIDPQGKHPFHKHADVDLFMAFDREKGGEEVGRIAVCVNHYHNRFHEERTAFFGFFECLPDYPVAEALLDTACRWARARDMDILRGPANFSTNEECALLVEGFDSPPRIMMSYNPPYYQRYIERYGFEKVMDAFAYYRSTGGGVPLELLSFADRLQKEGKIVIRRMNQKAFGEEVSIVHDIYNSAWERNWGFVPMDHDEFHALAKHLQKILIPELTLIAEVEGAPAAFSITVPDVNQALGKINGRLDPLSIARLWWHFRKIDEVRVLALGIRPEFRHLGIGPLLYLRSFEAAVKLGLKGGECSWTLETNDAINKAIENMGGERYKTYRFYDYDLKKWNG